MSDPGIVPASIGNTIATQIRSGALENFQELVSELSADGIGLAEDEAQDFGNLIDDFTESLEAGQSVSTAWSGAWQPFAAAEKSQLWNAAIGALKQIVSEFDGFIHAIEAVI